MVWLDPAVLNFPLVENCTEPRSTINFSLTIFKQNQSGIRLSLVEGTRYPNTVTSIINSPLKLNKTEIRFWFLTQIFSWSLVLLNLFWLYIRCRHSHVFGYCWRSVYVKLVTLFLKILNVPWNMSWGHKFLIFLQVNCCF